MCVTTATTRTEGEELIREDDTDPCKAPLVETVNENDGLTWSEESIAFVACLWELTEQETNDLTELGKRLCQKTTSAPTSTSDTSDDNSNNKDNDIDDSCVFVAKHHKTVPLQVVRFLRARPGNVDAAENMFRNMVAWRREHNVDTILEDYTPPDELVQNFPGAVLQGLDLEGDPIFLARTGVTDGAGFVKRFGRDELIKHAIWLRELVSRGEWQQEFHQERVQQQQQHQKQREEEGNNNATEQRPSRLPIRRMTLIDDLDGLSVFQIVKNRALLNVYNEVMLLDQNNYPETCKKLLIIRAPALFRFVWVIIKHFFDQGVIDKMEFCSPANYRQVLEHYVDLKVLPSCIVPEGEGRAREGMPPNFEGGRLAEILKDNDRQ